MRLIVLYGPPAVGKLTVAYELARLTGYRVFHNHMTVDFLDAVVGYGTRGFFQVLGELRIRTIEAAAKTQLPGLIFTFVYAKPQDDPFMRKLVQVMKRNQGKIYFVRLSCARNELFRRVMHVSRRRFRKIRTTAALTANLREANLCSDGPIPGGLSIDTTELSPGDTAQRIIQHFDLPVVSASRKKSRSASGAATGKRKPLAV